MADPHHTISEDNIHAAIWKNEGGGNSHYFTVSLSKSYESDGKTKYTSSFGHFDLIRVARLSLMATEWIAGENQKRNKKKTSSHKRRPGKQERQRKAS